MPTTLPLDPGDDAEGQLKPIAQFSQPAPAPQQKPAAPQTVVAANVAPQPVAGTQAAGTVAAPSARPVVATPAQPHGSIRPAITAPSLSLHRRQHAAATETQQTVAAAAQQARAFTDAELMQAWTQYIDNHATDRLLINTMRVSHPQRTATENAFEMVVESDIQVELINNALPDLLASLRKTLRNDLLSIHVKANVGESSPMTWNEREVLASMIDRHSTIKSFVEDLGLSLL